MRPLSTFIAVAAILVTLFFPVHGQGTVHSKHKTIYIDTTCTANPDFKLSWNVTMQSVKSAARRLAAPTDKDMANAVKVLFAVDRKNNATIYKKIKDTFEIVLNWREVVVPEDATWPERFDAIKKSHIRLFCNDREAADIVSPDWWNRASISKQHLDILPPNFADSRKNHAQKIPNEVKKKGKGKMLSKNKKYGRPIRWKKVQGGGVDVELYHDNINDMTPSGLWLTSFCHGRKILAMASRFVIPPKMEKNDMHYGQSPKRMTIDFCKALFQQKFKVITTKDLNWGKKGRKSAGDLIKHMIPMSILHELMHMAQPGVIVDFAYGWGDVASLEHDKAIANAESYAYLGMLAILADRGFVLSRKTEIDAHLGRMKWYDNVWGVKQRPPPVKNRYLAASMK